MVYKDDDCSDYPGSKEPALKMHFDDLEMFAGKLGVTVTHIHRRPKQGKPEGTYFDPAARVINVNTKEQTANGFVSLGALTDEYLHAWNQIKGRGNYITDEAASEHIRLGRDAERYGTKQLGQAGNVAFHKLEALNFLSSESTVPSFIWKIGLGKMREFATTWNKHSH